MGENTKARQKPLRGRRGPAGVARNTRAPVRPTIDGEDLDRLAREYLGVCAKGLRRLGADPGRKAAAALRGLPSRARYSARLLDDAVKLSLIHARWHRTTGYVDEDGHPRAIACSGPAPSYEALCTECDVQREWQRLLELAISFRMCSRLSEKKVAFLSEIALVTGIRSLMLARAVVTVERFLKTCQFNSVPGRRISESRADRTAMINLSEKEFGQFSNAMRRILHDFVESTDRRLLAGSMRDARLSRAHRSRQSGVTAFVFRD